MPGRLYVVATPIGNLGDISPRAIETLKSADFIAAEDTRVTRKLLTRFEISSELISCRAHNEREMGERILSRIGAGETCALVTDAGTPAISDPGGLLVREALGRGIEVLAIPGASALVSALSVSGIPCGRFVFEGFLPMNRRTRMERLSSLILERRAMVFYEAPHKLTRTLKDLLETFGDREISISRELTKIHEETRWTTLASALSHYETVSPKGEFVLVLAGGEVEESAPDLEEAARLAKELLAKGMSKKDAAKEAAQRTGASKKEIYARLLA